MLSKTISNWLKIVSMIEELNKFIKDSRFIVIDDDNEIVCKQFIIGATQYKIYAKTYYNTDVIYWSANQPFDEIYQTLTKFKICQKINFNGEIVYTPE